MKCVSTKGMEELREGLERRNLRERRREGVNKSRKQRRNIKG